MGQRLQNELVVGKALKLFSVFCNTPKPDNGGVAYKDCVVEYDEEDTPARFVKTRSPSANVYVGIHHKLLQGVDPVLEAALQRVSRIYEETFWSMPRAFDFMRACQAMAKRGLNVDYLTLLIGPGGVGLSLLSDFLHHMYGDENHRFFDPNVFYMDEELRKQLQNMFGGIIFTGQERPTGSKKPVREDLIKKFCTGESLAGRVPYGALTRFLRSWAGSASRGTGSFASPA